MLNSLNELYNLMLNEESLAVIKHPLSNYLLNYKNLIGRRHPLGFYSFTLGAINENINVRLHIWDVNNKSQDKDLMIHNHIFNFKSLVLFGRISNLVYSIADSGKSPGTMYSVSYNESGSILKKIKSGYSVSLMSETTIEKGNYYNVTSSVFHESKTFENEFSATLLITEKVSNPHPLVFGFKDFGNSIEFLREQRKVEEINYDITRLISLL